MTTQRSVRLSQIGHLTRLLHQNSSYPTPLSLHFRPSIWRLSFICSGFDGSWSLLFIGLCPYETPLRMSVEERDVAVSVPPCAFVQV